MISKTHDIQGRHLLLGEGLLQLLDAVRQQRVFHGDNHYVETLERKAIHNRPSNTTASTLLCTQ